jgi:hypothetical protein
MRQKGLMDSASKVAFELYDADAAKSIFIGQRNESAVLPSLNGHHRHHGYACSSRHHSQNGGELSAFKNYVSVAHARGRRPRACSRENSDPLLAVETDRSRSPPGNLRYVRRAGDSLATTTHKAVLLVPLGFRDGRD